LSTAPRTADDSRLTAIEVMLESIQDQLDSTGISQPVPSLATSVPSSAQVNAAGDLTGSMTLTEQMSSMQEEMRLLKQRVVGTGIAVGNMTFHSYEDLAIWVKTEVPQGRFGLFVDGHSLLDFFSFVGFLDAEAVANSFHSSQKSGFKFMLETHMAASMQNFFPAPFGKTAGEKSDDSESLPGIPDPEKFDNRSAGVKYKVLRGMKDISSQLEANIDKVLRDFPDAKQMAHDLLLNSKHFVINLMNFISQDSNSWKLQGYLKKEAWKMTYQSVHRNIDDLQGARMTGRDAGDGAELDHMTATYIIWTTAEAQEVMEDYLKYQFFEHPAIAAVLAHHLAATEVLPDEQWSSKVQQLDTKLSKLSTKVDGIESKYHARTHFAEGSAPASPTQSPEIRKKRRSGSWSLRPSAPQHFMALTCSVGKLEPDVMYDSTSILLDNNITSSSSNSAPKDSFTDTSNDSINNSSTHLLTRTAYYARILWLKGVHQDTHSLLSNRIFLFVLVYLCVRAGLLGYLLSMPYPCSVFPFFRNMIIHHVAIVLQLLIQN
jgi:hypothetical protein